MIHVHTFFDPPRMQHVYLALWVAWHTRYLWLALL